VENVFRLLQHVVSAAFPFRHWWTPTQRLLPYAMWHSAQTLSAWLKLLGKNNW
jgi:hypothetical protein